MMRGIRNPSLWHVGLIGGGCLLVGVIIGLLASSSGSSSQDTSLSPESTAEAPVYTCSMHPQIRQPEPGLCPLCGMELIPATDDSTSERDWQITLSDHAIKLASVQTAEAKRQWVTQELPLVGKIAVNERLTRTISAWVPGRIDRLFVDYTGMRVRKGEHMASVYSPELLTAQAELLEALKSSRSGSTAATRRLDAARQKLRLWGLNSEQIRDVESRGEPQEHMTLFAPTGGVVMEKHVKEGVYVKTGQPIYTLADLSSVWLLLDAYESDLAWLRYGQSVRFETLAYPGQAFGGRIVFVDPVIHARTRTAKVRVNVENPDSRLKPDMFVRASVQVTVTSDGFAKEPDLRGLFFCPMHPEIASEESGRCDFCDMPLESTESLGYVDERQGVEEPPLIIPSSAPLITGRRAVVYVALEGAPGTFEGREIALGPRAGEHFVVLDGLSEGERVVVNGNFKIDSELQIQARPSMLYHESTAEEAVAVHDEKGDHDDGGALKAEREAAPPQPAMDPIFKHYFDLHKSLSDDDVEHARSVARKLEESLQAMDVTKLDAASKGIWNALSTDLRRQVRDIASAVDLDSARKPFEALSLAMMQIAGSVGTPTKGPVYRFHCPMAFDNAGADWLQTTEDVQNPFFGSMMYRCGSMVGTVKDAGKHDE